jgi:hypothetical protein
MAALTMGDLGLTSWPIESYPLTWHPPVREPEKQAILTTEQVTALSTAALIELGPTSGLGSVYPLTWRDAARALRQQAILTTEQVTALSTGQPGASESDG